MVVVQCSVPQCEFKTEDISEYLAIALLQNHGFAHQVLSTVPAPSASNEATQAQATQHGPKLERPKVDIGVSEEEWNIFLRRWEVFRTGSGIDEASAPSQLFQCAGTDLGDYILKNNPTAASDSLTQLLSCMHSVAVIPVATCVLRIGLLQLRQSRDESLCAFPARVCGKAETCAFKSKCECGREVNYTDHVISDKRCNNGSHDPDIRREVLGIAEILSKPINDVITLVGSKEKARTAFPLSSLPALSSFQCQKTTEADQAKKASCPDCATAYKIYMQGARGWKAKPNKMYIECYQSHRTTYIINVALLQANNTSMPTPTSLTSVEIPATTKLCHHIFSKGEWRRAQLRDHPRVPITISLDRSGPTRRYCPTPTTGTQASLCNRRHRITIRPLVSN